ncbi:MAG: tRNA threonylcarbamoyladenosine biosynthesis protein TsaE [Halioglobus sp.]|jgi:tRNA threonylcarbamoyladenosine biosynthesis protein TsaE
MTEASTQCSVFGESAMLELGALLARHLVPGILVYLEGDLGMGKTTLARGIIQSLGHKGAVKSPTYTIVEPYDLTAGTVYHFDLYRLDDPEELEFMGIRDYFDGSSVCLIEWSQRGAGFLPPADLVITIEPAQEGRLVQLDPRTAAGETLVQLMAEKIAGLAGVK